MFKKHKSPNFNERSNGQSPSMLILHYTGMKNAKSALDRLCDPKTEVSAHYVIEESGKIHHLVDNDKRAWHAGKSYWQGETDINSASIGIEIVNPGVDFGYRKFPDNQIMAHEGIGLWPTPEEMDYQAAEDLILNPDALHELLVGFGYDPAKEFGETIRAFHRHFSPEKFTNKSDTPDEPDIATAAKLLSLIRQSHELS